MHSPNNQYLQTLQSIMFGLQSPFDRPVTITRFPDQWAKSKRNLTMTIRKFATLIEETEAATKEALPYFKLATFGRKKTVKGCLRSDANVVSISGVQGDYDEGSMTPEEAGDLLAEAGIAALICTTPSHGKPGKGQRWRVWCPCDDDLSPDQYFDLVARLNGALGGVLAGESFTLSQSFFAGRVTGGRAVQTILVDGRAINLCDDLDAGAMGKPTRLATDGGGDGGLDVDRAMQEVRSGAVIHTNLKSLAGRWMAEGMPYSEVKKQLLKLLDEEFEGEKDARWRQRKRGLDSILENIYGKEITSQFKDRKHKEKILDQMIDAGELAEIDALLGIEPKPEMDWGSPMEQNGKPINNQHNADFYLGTHRETIMPGLGLNLMTGREEWRDGEIRDSELDIARKGLERTAMKTVGMDLVRSAVRTVAARHAYHPVRDWLADQKDDGRGVLDDWLVTYARAADTPYTRAVGRAFLIGMVARVMRPGCKVDHVLVLQGQQGIGKSSLARMLASPAYFTDSLPPISGGKDVMTHLRGIWLVELSDMAPSRKSEAEELKAFLTTQVDRYRAPYGRTEEAHPRQCAFIGTSNPDQFLRDSTGGRRFWPVACTVINPAAMERDRGQLFAEALAAYQAGEAWWLDRAFEDEHAKPMQEAAYEQHPWQDQISEWLDSTAPDADGTKSRKHEVTVGEVMEDGLSLQSAQMNRAGQMEVSAILKRLGWEKAQNRRGRKVWRRGKAAHLEVVK